MVDPVRRAHRRRVPRRQIKVGRCRLGEQAGQQLVRLELEAHRQQCGNGERDVGYTIGWQEGQSEGTLSILTELLEVMSESVQRWIDDCGPVESASRSLRVEMCGKRERWRFGILSTRPLGDRSTGSQTVRTDTRSMLRFTLRNGSPVPRS